MKTDPLCVACLLKQAYSNIRLITDDPEEQVAFLRETADHIAQAPLADSPAVYSTPLYHKLSQRYGVEDLYADIKREQNELAQALLPHIEQAVRANPDPLHAAARIAAAGNLIDCGVGVPSDVETRLIAAIDRPWKRDESAAFFRQLDAGASRLLYILDNAGEIVFDTLFIRILKERYPALRIEAAVKQGPILNDALLEDASQARLDRAADRVLTTGSDYIGAPLDRVGPDFLEALEAADLFICKGHGNFETLNERPGGYLMLTAKCAAVAALLGIAEGDMAFVASGPDMANTQ